MIAGLTNHLWQSTVFALAAAILAGALRGNRAPVRHWIWVIASVKWLVPFAWLIAAGRALNLNLLQPAATGGEAAGAFSVAVRQFAEPFPAIGPSAMVTAPAFIPWVTTAVVVLWSCGVLAIAGTRLRDWRRIRAAVRQSARVDIALSDPRLDVRSAPGVLEPGVVGIWRPALLLPAGIEQQLTSAQLQSVLAHELCHVRRRDNLTAAVHMVVETAFWFHPLVWWIGARLIEERERACDEQVLSLGTHPRDYAEGIVNVCKHYVESPVACVSGVTGSHLTRRIEDIMMNRIGRSLSLGKKVMLTAAAVSVAVVPLVMGAATSPLRAQSATPAADAAGPQSTTVGDLAVMVKVITDPAATAADKERLIGKAFSGIVVVDQIRLYPTSNFVMAVPVPTAGENKPVTIAFRFSFTGRADDEKLLQLRKGSNARLRGTLTRFSVERGITWVDFSSLVIED